MWRCLTPLWAFYGFTICWAFNPTGGLWILYLLHAHWSLFDVGLAEAGFHMVSFFAEVPTGLFADRFGRRQSLAVGLIIHAITTVTTFLFAPNIRLLGFLSVSFGALAWSFIGGADRALLFGMVERQQGSGTFGRIYGRVLALNLAVRALATACGGILVLHLGWSMPYAIAAGTSLLGLAAVRSIPERPRGGVPGAPSASWSQMVQDLRGATRVVGTIPGLWLWVGFGAALATLVTINNLFAQSTLVLKGASVGTASLLVALAGLVTAAGSGVGGKLTGGNARRILSWGSLALGLAVASVGMLPLDTAAIGYLGAAGVDGMMDPVYENALNHIIPDDIRATVLSLPSTGFSLGMMLLFPAAGWAMEIHHLRLVYLVLGLGISVLAKALRDRTRLVSPVVDDYPGASGDSTYR